MACKYGKLEAVKYFLNNLNANLKAVSKDGENLLHFACKGGSLDVVKFLVEEKDFSLLTADDKGRNVLHFLLDGNAEDRIKRSVMNYLINCRSSIKIIVINIYTFAKLYFSQFEKIMSNQPV